MKTEIDSKSMDKKKEDWVKETESLKTQRL